LFLKIVFQMKNIRSILLLIPGLLLPVQTVRAQIDAGMEPAVCWSFEEGESMTIQGHYQFLPGISGQALKFDGFTTSVTMMPEEAPATGDAFSVEAWIALGAYPWNNIPVLAQENKEITGYFFGIDSRGRVGFNLSDGTAEWHECWSDLDRESMVGLELRKWYHIAGTFSRSEGIRVYINGELVASNPLPSRLVQAREVPVSIGRNNRPLPPTDPIRAWATFPSWYSFDGIIDEIRVYDGSLPAGTIADHYKEEKKENIPAIGERKFPTVKPSRRFGANFTTLKYYEEWDNLWPVGPHADVVVQFDRSPVKLMFWRGTRYSACWVSENGKWMADQSRETGGNWFLREGPADQHVTGCVEHMSDAQCRSSRVSIIENNPARIVVHWRYLQMDVKYRQVDLKDQSGFGQWADEYYYIYPDGVAMRKLLPGHGGWQETIFLNEPGTRPEDNVELEAVTLADMNGNSRSYSWENGFPRFDLKDAVIQMTNLKSAYRPFIIFREGVRFRVFGGEVRPEYSHFPWWNHWPVAQVASDGRSCIAADRASHSSLSWGFTDENVAMYGMTDQPAGELAMLARSWNSPPGLETGPGAFTSEGYDYTERVYKLTLLEKNSKVAFTLLASSGSPLYHPAFEIRNWGEGVPGLYMDGKEIPVGDRFRYGIEYDVEGNSKLVVYVEVQSSKPLEFEILRTSDPD
jgi:hypothetical protein